MTCGSCLCCKHIINLVTGVSRLPVLGCGMTFHPDCPLTPQTISEISFIWPVKKWHGYLTGARCRLAYGPADTTATHCLLVPYNPHWFNLLVPVHPSSPVQRTIKRVCVCVCVRARARAFVRGCACVCIQTKTYQSVHQSVHLSIIRPVCRSVTSAVAMC